MRSAVAGEFIVKWPVKPDSVLAEEIASLIAKKTLDARNKGGSPIACKIKELYHIIQLKLLNKKKPILWKNKRHADWDTLGEERR
jgi:hypothetical protein